MVCCLGDPVCPSHQFCKSERKTESFHTCLPFPVCVVDSGWKQSTISHLPYFEDLTETGVPRGVGAV